MSAFHTILKPVERFILDITVATATVDAALFVLKRRQTNDATGVPGVIHAS